jgi:hypothetical protein
MAVLMRHLPGQAAQQSSHSCEKIEGVVPGVEQQIIKVHAVHNEILAPTPSTQRLTLSFRPDQHGAILEAIR